MTNEPPKRKLVRSLTRAAAVAGVMTLAGSATASAQACLGAPGTHAGWSAVHLGRGAQVAAQQGIEVGRQFGSRFAAYGTLARARFDDVDPTRRHVGAGGALIFSPPQAMSACLTAGVEHTRIADVEVMSIPVGIALAEVWTSASGTWRLVPHLQTQLVFRTASIPGFSKDSQEVVARGGALVGYGRFFVGTDYEREMNNRRAWSSRVRFGVGF